jgi:hypothetical protein
MKNKTIILSLLLILITSTFASFSKSLSFTSNVETTCGLIFKNRGSIAFKGEEPKLIGDFEVVSNIDKRKDIFLKIKNVQKSINLLDVNDSDIYIIIVRFNRTIIKEMTSKGIKIGNKKHKMHIYINKNRNNITAGKSALSFELELICNN